MTEPKQAGEPKQFRPLSDKDPTGDETSCGYHGGRRKDGKPCVSHVIKGTIRCRMHAGKPGSVAKASGEVVTAVKQALGYDGPVVDSGEIMLKASSMAWYRAQMLTEELDRVVGEHDSLREALTGNTYAVTESGDKVKTGEYIRAMAQLEAQWWDRAFTYATKVTAAKLAIADRKAAMVDRQAGVFYDILRAVLFADEVALTPTQRATVLRLLRESGPRLGITT